MGVPQEVNSGGGDDQEKIIDPHVCGEGDMHSPSLHHFIYTTNKGL